MIITSLPRSGSTKFCTDLAAKLNLPLYDEIFEFELNDEHKTKLHQISDIEPVDKSILFLKTLDFEKCIISNHEISFFTLEKTDIFLSRKNVQDSVWSWLEYMDRYFDQFIKENGPMGQPTQPEFKMKKMFLLNFLLNRYLKRAKYFFEYCIANNKEVVISDLTYRDNTAIKEKFKFFSTKINNYKSELILPDGIVFE